ncbi:MAG: hypothetical protein A3A33_04420 [Candidatus Yanofskybacteria bacterium RIFCSPLOWO2_01_FULL_49_25]|uniref:Biopterin-dependent aromatic amino acid hydroxylase family profile domain-containing protein n=1 Tax=Candidatus Yanofskybacteria bacterium RIFCSPLOWO2_01_FULL_49_25 TaxID=1802701 RepID=A0A1F8GWD1_9BACT|nr:MAG: hypothetical protein A3A33_04420 [Candidatus Yanofskybacteria bacterium RIFCSPLOWO2_01_FULL_49_25]
MKIQKKKIVKNVVRNSEHDITVLKLDHPGATDKIYRARRDFIAEHAGSINYLPEENKTWQIATRNLAELHRKLASTKYLMGKNLIELPTDHIPQLEALSRRLHTIGGFRVVPVEGLIDAKTFLSRLGRGVMSSTQYIRHASHPEYTPEPDIIHEVVGHIPMFADADFVAFSRLLGQAAGHATPEQMPALERLYWFTIEFGLIEEQGQTKIYGAGLLSSFGEMPHALSSHVDRLPFSIEKVIASDYTFSEMQNKLFVIKLFAALKKEVELWLAKLQKREEVKLKVGSKSVQV